MFTCGPLSMVTDSAALACSAWISAAEDVMRASRKSRSDTSSSRAALALFQSLLMKGWPTLSRQSSRSFCTRCAYSGRVIRPVKPRSTEDTVVRLPDTMPMSQVSPPMSVPASRVTVGKIALRGERGQRGVARAAAAG